MENSQSTKLFDLASAEISKTSDAKALDALKDAVEENHNAFQNDLFAAGKRLKEAIKIEESLKSNPYATAETIIHAKRDRILAEKNVADIREIIAIRF